MQTKGHQSNHNGPWPMSHPSIRGFCMWKWQVSLDCLVEQAFVALQRIASMSGISIIHDWQLCHLNVWITRKRAWRKRRREKRKCYQSLMRTWCDRLLWPFGHENGKSRLECGHRLVINSPPRPTNSIKSSPNYECNASTAKRQEPMRQRARQYQNQLKRNENKTKMKMKRNEL